MWAPASADPTPVGPLEVETFVGNWGDPFGARVQAVELAGYDWTEFTWEALVTTRTREGTLVTATVTDNGTTSTALDILVTVDDGTVLLPDQDHTLSIRSVAGSPIEHWTVKIYILQPRKAALT